MRQGGVVGFEAEGRGARREPYPTGASPTSEDRPAVPARTRSVVPRGSGMSVLVMVETAGV